MPAAVHARDQPPPERGEAGVAAFVAAVGEDIGGVVGEDRAPDAGGEKSVDQVEVGRERRRRLEVERDREAALRPQPDGAHRRIQCRRCVSSRDSASVRRRKPSRTQGVDRPVTSPPRRSMTRDRSPRGESGAAPRRDPRRAAGRPQASTAAGHRRRSHCRDRGRLLRQAAGAAPTATARSSSPTEGIADRGPEPLEALDRLIGEDEANILSAVTPRPSPPSRSRRHLARRDAPTSSRRQDRTGDTSRRSDQPPPGTPTGNPPAPRAQHPDGAPARQE